MKFVPSLLLLVCLQSAASAQALKSKFDSKGHPKAKGVWLSIRYPQSFEMEEGERPNIVKKFSGNYQGVFTLLMVQVKSAGQNIEQECKSASPREWEEIFTEADSGMIATNAVKVTHEFQPGAVYNVNHSSFRAGISLNGAYKIMSLCYKDKLISASCGAVSAQTETVNSTRKLQKIEPICTQYFNSLVLMDKY